MNAGPAARGLSELLDRVARPYGEPPLPALPPESSPAYRAAVLARAIEEARGALAAGVPAPEALAQRFTEALARCIEQTMDPQRGDPAYQALVLRQGAPALREHLALAQGAAQDRRQLQRAVDGIAHPARPAPSGALPRAALAALHTQARAQDWPALRDTLRDWLSQPAVAADAALAQRLRQLQASPALARLLQWRAGEEGALVRQHRALLQRQGPRAGSEQASSAGREAQRRGDAVEARARAGLQTWVDWLNQGAEPGRRWRVASGLQVPASLCAGRQGAKTEWDVALLREGAADAEGPVWDLCLLVEAKASADAVAGDFARLLQGLRLLAQAAPQAPQVFATAEGALRLSGASLAALPQRGDALRQALLYVCDSPAGLAPRPLDPTSSAKLLGAPASVQQAERCARGEAVQAQALLPVWRCLCEAPGWHGVLTQYARLRELRGLMVRTADLGEAVPKLAGD